MTAAHSEIAESNSAFAEAMSLLALRTGNGTVDEFPGAVASFGRVKLPFFNMAFLTRPVDGSIDLRQRLRKIVDYGNKSGVSWLLGVCDPWIPPDCREELMIQCEAAGLFPLMKWSGMVAEELNSAPPPVGIEIRNVEDPPTRRAVADINCLSYAIPVEWGREALDHPRIWTAGFFGSVGYAAEKPVSTSTVVVAGSILYVAMVATLPEFRRKGYAEAVLRHSLDSAKRATGLHRTVLHATDAGYPVYLKMGYRVTASFTCFGQRH